MNKDTILTQILILERSAKTCDEYARVADQINQLRALLGEDENQQKGSERRKLQPQDKALLYLFELDSKGQQLPIRIKEGTLDKKELERIGEEDYECNGDSFYRAVKKIKKIYDLNKIVHLEQINKNWLSLIKDNCKDWSKMSKYLENKLLYQG